MKGRILFSLLCLAAGPAVGSPADDARAHSMAFANAVNARDAKAVLALYAPDAHVVWPGEGEEAHGRAEIEKLVAKVLSEMPKDAKLTLQSQTAIPLDARHIATVGHWIQSFTDPDGKAQSVPVRTTEIIAKEKGKTLYVVDHASVGQPPPPPAAASQQSTSR